MPPLRVRLAPRQSKLLGVSWPSWRVVAVSAAAVFAAGVAKRRRSRAQRCALRGASPVDSSAAAAPSSAVMALEDVLRRGSMESEDLQELALDDTQGMSSAVAAFLPGGRLVAPEVLVGHSISVAVERAYPDGPFVAEGVLEVEGLSSQTLWAHVVDHSNAPRVFRNIRSVQLTDQGDGVRHMEQHLRWSALLFKGSFTMTLELREDAAAAQSRFCKISPGGVMRSMEGMWAVSASPDRSGVRVVQTFTAELSVPRSRYFNGVTRRVVTQLVRHNMEDLLGELSRRYSPTALAS